MRSQKSWDSEDDGSGMKQCTMFFSLIIHNEQWSEYNASYWWMSCPAHISHQNQKRKNLNISCMKKKKAYFGDHTFFLFFFFHCDIFMTINALRCGMLHSIWNYFKKHFHFSFYNRILRECLLKKKKNNNLSK